MWSVDILGLHTNLRSYLYKYIHIYIYIYLCVCDVHVLRWDAPLPSMPVASEDFISESPTKNVVFLVVTVAERGFPIPNYILVASIYLPEFGLFVAGLSFMGSSAFGLDPWFFLFRKKWLPLKPLTKTWIALLILPVKTCRW